MNVLDMHRAAPEGWLKGGEEGGKDSQRFPVLDQVGVVLGVRGLAKEDMYRGSAADATRRGAQQRRAVRLGVGRCQTDDQAARVGLVGHGAAGGWDQRAGEGVGGERRLDQEGESAPRVWVRVRYQEAAQVLARDRGRDLVAQVQVLEDQPNEVLGEVGEGEGELLGRRGREGREKKVVRPEPSTTQSFLCTIERGRVIGVEGEWMGHTSIAAGENRSGAHPGFFSNTHSFLTSKASSSSE